MRADFSKASMLLKKGWHRSPADQADGCEVSIVLYSCAFINGRVVPPWSSEKDWKALFDRKQKEEGWLVLYWVPANAHAWARTNAMGLHAGNVAAFDKQAIEVSMAAIGARGSMTPTA